MIKAAKSNCVSQRTFHSRDVCCVRCLSINIKSEAQQDERGHLKWALYKGRVRHLHPCSLKVKKKVKNRTTGLNIG